MGLVVSTVGKQITLFVVLKAITLQLLWNRREDVLVLSLPKKRKNSFGADPLKQGFTYPKGYMYHNLEGISGGYTGDS